jgi:hypothetical protein
MANQLVKNILIIAIVTVFIFSLLSPLAFGSSTYTNLVKNTSRNEFISKSSGLNIPDKEGGKTELELADINNDGYLDIICVGDHGSPYVNSQQHGIMVWLGDGGDTWSVEQVGDFGYGGIEAGDLNLDGYLDVVWGIHHDWGDSGFGDTLIGAALGDGSASNWTGWAIGLGSGGEDWGMFATDLADFDCNGLLDIISQSFGCCNGYHLYENHGNGNWSHKWSLSGGNTYNNIEIGDFNADGYPDFVGNREGTYVFLGDGSFDFSMTQKGLPTSSWNGHDCGDMNHDGCDDLVIGFSSAGVRCYQYDSLNNEWDIASDGLPTTGLYYPQFGDINGDGFLDILAYSPPTGYLYLGDGEGNWESDASFTLPTTGDYSAFVVDGDFDHDGREDIVIQAEQGSWPSYKNYLHAYSLWGKPYNLTAHVATPQGGETFRSGSIRNIRWLSAVPLTIERTSVDIQVSLNGESGPWDTIISDIANNGCYQWLVNAGGSKTCRIKIIVYNSTTSISANSESNFTIIGFNVDAHGPYNGLTGESIQFTGSADNGTPPYTYYWDFGDGNFSNEQNPTHRYDIAGNFTVILSVIDSNNITIRDSTWAFILGDYNPPTTPIIKGPTSGKVKKTHTYTVNSTDPTEGSIFYLIDWGDGNFSGWLGPCPSGKEWEVSHSWNEKGTFTIKSKAKGNGGESDWGILEVTMPQNEQIHNGIFKTLNKIFSRVFALFKILLI